jgi:hypothetical protein
MRTMEGHAEPAKRKPGARTSYGMPSLDGGHPAKYGLCFPLFASAGVRGGNSCPDASRARSPERTFYRVTLRGRIFRLDRAIPSDSMTSDSVRSQPRGASRAADAFAERSNTYLNTKPGIPPGSVGVAPAPEAGRRVSSNPPGRQPAISILAGSWPRQHPVYPGLRPRCAVRGR